MVIRGGIDGYSRSIVYLHFSDNNRATTVFQCFREVVLSYGLPSRVRSDRGGCVLQTTCCHILNGEQEEVPLSHVFIISELNACGRMFSSVVPSCTTTSSITWKTCLTWMVTTSCIYFVYVMYSCQQSIPVSQSMWSETHTSYPRFTLTLFIGSNDAFLVSFKRSMSTISSDLRIQTSLS